MTIYDYEVTRIDGTKENLATYAGKVVLIVNTASKCGYAPQLEGLEELYQTYGDRDFTVLGFPSGQFLGQEYKENEEILEFCQKNYGVTFPMHEKIKVNGKGALPLYKYLVGETGGKRISWNFNKFLIDSEGNVVERFESKVTPAEIKPAIEKALAK